MKEKFKEIIKLAEDAIKELECENSDCGSPKKQFTTNEFGQREFTHCGITYVNFKDNDFVAKTILSKEIIDDIVEDKRYLDSDKDVRYNSNIFDNSWEHSFIKGILNEEFKDKYLNNIGLVGEVRCLTKEEAEGLPDNLKETERYGYWTMSPYGMSTNGYAYVFYVFSNGYLGNYGVFSTGGVRPVFSLKESE